MLFLVKLDLTGARFGEADLTGAFLEKADLPGADLGRGESKQMLTLGMLI